MFILFCLLLFGSESSGLPASTTSNDIDSKITSGHYFQDILKHLANGGEERLIRHYFGKNSRITWIDQENHAFSEFEKIYNSGLTLQGLTFNIYDDAMRKEAIALFKLLQTLETDIFHMTVAWASVNINSGILEYSVRLAALHSKHLINITIPAPFVIKPNYFFNSETIQKAQVLKIRHGHFNPRDAKVNQYHKLDDVISINTNYSGWNLLGNGCLEDVAYFREDIALNSYYYGVHLTHPFWMTNDELEKLSTRQIEQYYYIHQQLLARYLLEVEANEINEREARSLDPMCNFPTYDPYLQYCNGLPFPVRYPYEARRDFESASYLSSVDTIIKELAGRGLNLVKTYGKSLNMTKENFLEVVTKIIRANIDNAKYGKMTRSLYGAQGYPVDRYNPAPSVLHHPETTLRDPIYWSLVGYVMDYFYLFKRSVAPNNLTEIETKEFAISLKHIPKLVTHFEYYQSDITNIVLGDETKTRNIKFTARQKRLNHNDFDIELTVNSKDNNDCVVKLFLGPECNEITCFQNYNRWFELDILKIQVIKGKNLIKWRSTQSEKYSNDESYNIEMRQDNDIENDSENVKAEYNMFKFPNRLLIPKGSASGFNVTLFIMITEYSDLSLFESVEQPFGFPFDREIVGYNPDALNYRLFNISVYHNVDETKTSSGYFSPNLS